MTIETTAAGDASNNRNPASTAPFATTISGLLTIAALLRGCGEKLIDVHVGASYVAYKAHDETVALVGKLDSARTEGFRPDPKEDPGYDFSMIEFLAESALALLEKERAIEVLDADADVGEIDDVEIAIAGVPALMSCLAEAYERDADGLLDRTIVRH